MDDGTRVSLLEAYHQAPSSEGMAKLLEEYLPLAKRIARRFAGRGVETEDLEQVAAMGLMKAIKRFEPDRGLQFITYATPTIAGDVRNYIRDKGDSLRLPRDMKNRLYHLEKVRDSLYQQHMREPTVPELAEAMGMSFDGLLQLLDMRKNSDVYSLDASLDTEQEQSFSAMLGKADEGFGNVELQDWLKWVYSIVNPTEAKLLKLRYDEGLGQRETAKHLGISQMQVSRMERRLLGRLRAIEQRDLS